MDANKLYELRRQGDTVYYDFDDLVYIAPTESAANLRICNHYKVGDRLFLANSDMDEIGDYLVVAVVEESKSARRTVLALLPFDTKNDFIFSDDLGFDELMFYRDRDEWRRDVDEDKKDTREIYETRGWRYYDCE